MLETAGFVVKMHKMGAFMDCGMWVMFTFAGM